MAGTVLSGLGAFILNPNKPMIKVLLLSPFTAVETVDKGN